MLSTSLVRFVRITLLKEGNIFNKYNTTGFCGQMNISENNISQVIDKKQKLV